MQATVEYTNGGSEATIRTADGGIATCHHSGEHIITSYYQSRTTAVEPDFDELAEGKMYLKDWEDKQEIDSEVIMDALAWLVMPQPEFKITEHLLFDAPCLN